MKRTILIADDDPSVRNFLHAILEGEGYDVIQAESGEQALAVTQALQPAAFILDVEMPGMSGITLCRAIRQIERHRSTPIIFLTGSDTDDTIDKAFSAGGDDFIAKPSSAAAVRARLKSHLQRSEYSQRLEWLRSVLKRYVSRRTLDVVENAAATGTLPPPQEQDLAICFTDMRGFTAFAEDMEPTRLFALVSELLADQVQIIHEFGGYVDKFGGDGVMAIFEGPDMVVQSCLCALRILESARLRDIGVTVQTHGFGIGIHAGRAVIGNIGSPEHLDYSAIGSAVNLAARLCGQAQAMSVVVSKAVREGVAGDSRLKFHSERHVPIRGIKETVTVYTLSRP
ncbi:MAG TPA: adenylate/guanylate cyclase domain-containing response regulator [Terriglobia bacterium]|jgi:class 3 adenylate cyclase